MATTQTTAERFVLIASIAVIGSIGSSRAAELTETECKLIADQLQPQMTKPWRTIPWRISLLEAQAVASKEQKPLFIWAMDGHPLGCT